MAQRNYVRGGLAVFAAALALTTGTAAYGQAEVMHETTYTPLELITVNDCTGEEVQIEGFSQTSFTFIETPSGMIHSRSHSLTMGVGEGLTSGAHYVFQLESNDSFTVDEDDLPSEFVDSLTVHVIAQGSIEGFYLNILVHQTISASGVVTPLHVEIQTDCR